MQERLTETFRGTWYKRKLEAWKRDRIAEGWTVESFSGVSGVGAYRSCSLTMVRTVAAPVTPMVAAEFRTLTEMAWGIIANVGGVNGEGWAGQGTDWVGAATRWRDQYHRALMKGV